MLRSGRVLQRSKNRFDSPMARRVLHWNVTDGPGAQWTAQQVVEAFPEDTAPKYIIRDRDGIYGAYFKRRVESLGIEEILTAPRSPWQNPYVERLVGSIRRECLDHVIVLNEHHLRRILTAYFAYYHRSRTHLSGQRRAGAESRPAAEHGPDSRAARSRRPAPPLRALRGLTAISLRHSDATDMGGRALRTGRMQPHSDTDRAPDVGVLAREHAVGITFRPESPPVGALDDRLAKDRLIADVFGVSENRVDLYDHSTNRRRPMLVGTVHRGKVTVECDLR